MLTASNSTPQKQYLIGISGEKQKSNDASRQEQARHEATVKNMHRLRALRLA